MSLEGLAAKAQVCLELRTEIPGAPDWDEEVFDAGVSFQLIQNTVDYLACKAQIEMPLLDDEKTFMKALFEDLWGGGQYPSYREAATLADHYVNGAGEAIKINADMCRSSIIVKDAMTALKVYIKDLANKNKPYTLLKSNDLLFLNTSHARSLQRERQNMQVQGYLKNTGELVIEKDNRRLRSVTPQFCLHVQTTRSGQGPFMSSWKMAGTYRYGDFAVDNNVTDIFLGGDFTLQLPDGLARYLSRIGLAREFDYHAEWHDTWI